MEKENEDKYKKLDKTILQWCPFVLLLLITIGVLFSSLSAIGGNQTIIQTIIFYTYIILCIFTASYIFLSLLFWIIGLVSKEFKENYKNKFYLKICIIAVVIIIILIICSISCIGCNSRNITPMDNTKRLLQTQVNNPGAESCTDPVTFTKQDSQISAEGITNNSGLDPEQVIFANPQEISNFEASNSLLKYRGATSYRIKMCIICADGKTNLEQALLDNGISLTVNSTIEDQLLCGVYPNKTT